MPLRKEKALIKVNDTLLDKYKVVSFIAKGGMSTVWLAEDLALHKKWAIKVIDKTSKGYKASVNPDGTLTEVRILTELDNPYAPRIVDRIETEEHLAVVMDFIKGKNLLEVLKEEGPQDSDKVINWMICICELLQSLHGMRNPVIYCDMKPENIILKDDSSIKVIDFGIAKIPSLYEKNIAIGTAGYASPEHYQGKTDELSDIYTLGMTMYHLLTGNNPAKKDFKMVPVKNIVPNISKELEAIITKATQKKPDKRYQSAAEMKDALWECKIMDMTDELDTRTVLLDEAEATEEVAEAKPKETPAAPLKQSKSATFLQVLFNGIGGLFRTIAFIVLAVFAAIGIHTLMEPALRELFIEEMINLYETVFSDILPASKA